MTSGSKRWRFRYYENGKEAKLALGEYPHISLREARERRDELKRGKEHGLDPQNVLHPPAAITFEMVALEWHEKKVTPKTKKYADKVLSILKRLVFPFVGARNIRELTAIELLEALRAIETKGLNDTASTALQICGQIYRYAVAAGCAEQDITLSLRGALAPVIVTHNASITDPVKVKELIRALSAFSGSEVVRNALWISIYTFQRPGEIRRMEWNEIDFEAREWRIPGLKMKMRRQHIVPMSRQVVEILRRLKPLTGYGRYVLPSIRSVTGDTPMSENTINAALRRLGFGKDEMSAHGFRSMASTLLHEQGWPSDSIERQLAHIEGNSVKAAYNYAEYLPQRREMMQHWADWLDGLVEKK
jgi:integrase